MNNSTYKILCTDDIPLPVPPMKRAKLLKKTADDEEKAVRIKRLHKQMAFDEELANLKLLEQRTLMQMKIAHMKRLYELEIQAAEVKAEAAKKDFT